MKLKKPPVRQNLDFKFEGKEGEHRDVLSVRLPKALLKELDRLAERSGYKKTELIQYAVDQLCQAMKN